MKKTFRIALVAWTCSFVFSPCSPVTADVAHPTPEEQKFEQALIGTSWEWGYDVGMNWRLQFKANHVALQHDKNGHVDESRWWVTGPRTIHRQFPPRDPKHYAPSTGHDVICNDSISRITHPDKKRTLIASRMGSIDPSKLPPPTPPRPSNIVAKDKPVAVSTHKADEPQIKILSEESVSVTGWITSPLDVAVPEQIWENLNFMKEALRDEAAQKPAANPASYQLAVRLCLKMLENLAERDTASTRAGGNAVLHQKSNLTQQNRDHLTWPQYALERDERTERQMSARNADKFMNGHYAVEWNNKTTSMRKEMQAMYSQFREALRQSAAK